MKSSSRQTTITALAATTRAQHASGARQRAGRCHLVRRASGVRTPSTPAIHSTSNSFAYPDRAARISTGKTYAKTSTSADDRLSNAQQTAAVVKTMTDSETSPSQAPATRCTSKPSAAQAQQKTMSLVARSMTVRMARSAGEHDYRRKIDVLSNARSAFLVSTTSGIAATAS